MILIKELLMNFYRLRATLITSVSLITLSSSSAYGFHFLDVVPVTIIFKAALVYMHCLYTYTHGRAFFSLTVRYLKKIFKRFCSDVPFGKYYNA